MKNLWEEWKLYKSILIGGLVILIISICKILEWETIRVCRSIDIILLMGGLTNAGRFYSLRDGYLDISLKSRLPRNIWLVLVFGALGLLCLTSIYWASVAETLRTTFVVITFDYLSSVSRKEIAIDKKKKRERLRTCSLNYDEQIFDSFEEGYFVAQGVPQFREDLFLVKYSNKSGDKILSNFNASLSQFSRLLIDAENSDRTLFDIIQLFAGKEVISGFSMKVSLRMLSKKGYLDKEEEARERHSPIKMTKTLAFKTYKARVTKLNKVDILVILSEKTVSSSLDMEKSFRNTIICTLSHEMRNLLTGVIGNLELFAESRKLQGKEKVWNKIATSTTYVLANRLNDLFD